MTLRFAVVRSGAWFAPTLMTIWGFGVLAMDILLVRDGWTGGALGAIVAVSFNVALVAVVFHGIPLGLRLRTLGRHPEARELVVDERRIVIPVTLLGLLQGRNLVRANRPHLTIARSDIVSLRLDGSADEAEHLLVERRHGRPLKVYLFLSADDRSRLLRELGVGA